MNYPRFDEHSRQPMASGSNQRRPQEYDDITPTAPHDRPSFLPYYQDPPRPSHQQYPMVEPTFRGQHAAEDYPTYATVDTSNDSMVEEKAEYLANEDLNEAKRMKQRRKCRWFYIPLIALGIVAAVAIPVGVLLSKKMAADAQAQASDPLLTNGGSLSGDVGPVVVANVTVSSVAVGSSATSVRVAAAGTSSGVVSKSASIVAPSATAVAAPVASPQHRLVVFGASYCDDGHPRPAQYSASLRQAPYFGGRSSNGIVWNEYLAPMIGTANKAADLRNYAYSGAMVDNSITSANVPDTKAQFASFIADIKSGLVPALPKGSRTLIAVWIGINPLMEIYFSAFPNRTPVSASTFSSKSGGALSMVNVTGAALVQQIASLQATLLALNYPADIMVLPLSPLNELPFAVYTAGGNSQLFNFMQTMADAYNAVVQAGVAQVGRTAGASIMPWVDLPTYYRSVVSNPSSVSLSDVTNACLTGTSSVCSTPTTHLWWDSIHMTTTMHQKLAAHLSPIINTYWSS